MSIKSSRSRQAQIGLLTTFFVQGVTSTVMIPRIPELIDQIGVNFTAWGAILGFAGIGSLIGLTMANRLIVRFSSRRVLQVSTVVSALLIALLPFITDPWVFFALQLVMSFVGSCLGIALNAQAVVLQKLINRTIIGRFHGAWSIGAASSAAVSAFLASFMPIWLHLALIPGLAAVAFLWCTRLSLTPEEVGKANERKNAKKTSFFNSPKELWLLAFGLFAGVMPEIAVMDWSAVFSKKVLFLDAGLGAVPYTIFGAAMIVSRLSIGRLTKTRHISDVAKIGGFYGAIALALGVFIGPLLSLTDPILGLAATSFFWLFAGLGVGPMAPTFFAGAGTVKGLTTPQALARMSLTNSILIMGAKVLLGALAQNVNLIVAFVFPTVMMFIAALVAGQLSKRIDRSAKVVEDAFPMTGPIGIISADD